MTDFINAALSGKHVVIVGGSSGMGKAIAKLSANYGAKVTIASRNLDKLKAAATQIGGDITIQQIDTTDESALRSWANSINQIDHLIISASSAAHGLFKELPTNDLRQMFESKFIGPYVTARTLLSKIAANGSITFFSGVLSRRPSVSTTGLAAVNAAVEALTKGLAQELAGTVRVNCISPGMIDTEAYAAIPESDRHAMYQQVGSVLPVGRVGTAEEIAEASLLTLINSFVTGIVLDVDGGHLVRA